MSFSPDNTCFQNIIALDTVCGGSVPTSGLYASSIGITEKFLSQVVTSDFSGVKDLFEKKMNLAIDMIANNIHSSFADKYRAVSVVDNFRTGIHLDNRVPITPSNSYKGIFFDLNSERSYLDFFLSEINLFTAYTGTIDLLFIDLTTGEILHTIPVDTTDGEISTIYPSLIFASKKRRLKLFVGYDTTGITSYKTVLRNSSCSSCTPTYRLRNSYENIISATIALGSDFKRANIATSNDSGGLSIVHSLQCNHRDWLCSVSNQLAYPILYKTASLILEFALLESPNERYNTTDTNNADLIQKRLDAVNLQFAQSMDTLVGTMRVPSDEKCFVCKQTQRHAIILP